MKCCVFLVLLPALVVGIKLNPRSKMVEKDKLEEAVSNQDGNTNLIVDSAHLSMEELDTEFQEDTLVDQAEREDDVQRQIAFGNLDGSAFSEACQQDIRAGAARNKECADPWPKTKDCKSPYQVPLYRLGDLVGGFGEDYKHNVKWTKTYFPESIGGRYLQLTSQSWADFKLLRKILDSEYYANYQKPDENTVVVHLRGYDVFAQNQSIGHKTKIHPYTKPQTWYEDVAKQAADAGMKKAVIVTGDHKLLQQASGLNVKQRDMKNPHHLSPEKIQQAIKETESKLKEIKEVFSDAGLEVSERVNWNADCDFVFMSNAHMFVPSVGKFDNVIKHMLYQKGGDFKIVRTKADERHEKLRKR